VGLIRLRKKNKALTLIVKRNIENEDFSHIQITTAVLNRVWISPPYIIIAEWGKGPSGAKALFRKCYL
jgi:hypothetical protein